MTISLRLALLASAPAWLLATSPALAEGAAPAAAPAVDDQPTNELAAEEASEAAGLGAESQATEDDTERAERSIIVIGQKLGGLDAATTTGSRLGISLMETPATISTLDGDEIRARGDFTFMDAVTRAPGVTGFGTPGNGNTSIALRGFVGQSSVMHLFGGVRLFPVAGTITFPFDSWNIERIEVLNGPGSVQFGQGALGGVINVVPKTASFDRWEVDGLASYGSFETVQLAAGISGPLTDKLAFRADASYRRSDGFVDRGQSQSLALSGALEWRPLDDLSIELRHDFGDNEPMRYWGTPVANGVLDLSMRRENYNVEDAVIDWQDHRTQLHVKWALGNGITLNSATYRLSSLRIWQNLENYSLDPLARTVRRSGNLGIGHDSVQWGNQTWFTIDQPIAGDLRNTLVFGVDLNWIDVDYSHSFGSAPQVDVVNATSFAPGAFLDTVGLLPRWRTDTRTRALYAENRLAFSDRLSMIGGVRYEESRVGRWNFIYDPGTQSIVGESPALAGGAEEQKEFKDFTWKLGAVYEPVGNLSLFAQYVTGVDPVGTLATFTPAANQFAFVAPRGHMSEAGVKAILPDGIGFATISAYRIVKNELTVQEITNGPLMQIGQQSSTGVEAAITLNLPHGFGIDANGTLLDAEFESFFTPTSDFTGNTPLNVPEAAANVSLRWDPTARLQLRSNLRWVGRRFTNNQNTLELPSFTVVDLIATYALTPRVAVDVRGGNVFDEVYAMASYGPQQWILGRPRSIDVAVRFAY